MNINIPDKLYKLLTLIGLIIIGYSEYNDSNATNKWDKISNKLFSINNTLSLEEITSSFNLKKMEDSGENIKKSLKNPNLKNKESYLDSLKKLLVKSDYLTYRNNILIEKSRQNARESELAFNEYKSSLNANKALQNVGFCLLFIGLFLWYIDENNSKLLIKQNEKIYTRCQSCAKTFSSMLQYGTNEDLSNNYSFCENCYDNGIFTNPEATKEEYLTDALNKTKNDLLTKKVLNFRFNNIERWNNRRY